MNEEELNKIAQVIRNKIYSENAKHVQLSRSDKLEKYRITIPVIKYAIIYNEDLNQLNDVPMQNYITTDLNAFFTKILAVREINMDYYVYMILEGDIDSFLFAIEDILECFTEEENMPIKKAFLKRMLNGYDVDAMEKETICRLFLPLFEEKINLERQKIGRKLVQ